MMMVWMLLDCFKMLPGEEVSSRVFCRNECKLVVALYQPGNPVSINEQIVSNGLARVSKATEVEALCAKMINMDNLSSLWLLS